MRTLEDVKTAARCHHTGFFYAKDEYSRFIDADADFLSFCGLSSIEQLYHKTDYDMPFESCAKIYVQHDQEAMTAGKLQVFEPTVDVHGKPRLLLTDKYFYFDKAKNIQGVMGFSRVVEYETVKRYGLLEEQANFNSLKISESSFNNKVNQKAKTLLTDRELDVLYYLLHGLSQKQVAHKLNLSVRTVEDYVDHVKAKLRCGNKYQLFEFALEHGLMSIIPKHLLI